MLDLLLMVPSSTPVPSMDVSKKRSLHAKLVRLAYSTSQKHIYRQKTVIMLQTTEDAYGAYHTTAFAEG